MVFLLPASAHFLEQKWYTFYPQVLQSVLSRGITGILDLCANMMIILDKEARGYLLGMFIRKIFGKG